MSTQLINKSILGIQSQESGEASSSSKDSNRSRRNHNKDLPIEPTFKGYVETDQDALLLIELAIRNRVPAVPRRVAANERNELIKAGSIFVFERDRASVDRWTDGIHWSPSRCQGNFLLYRQVYKESDQFVKDFYAQHPDLLEDGKPPRIRTRGQKRKRKSPSKTPELNADARFDNPTTTPGQHLLAPANHVDTVSGEYAEYYGSHIGNGPLWYVPGGLVKKTFTVPASGEREAWHVICYFDLALLQAGSQVPRPTQCPNFYNVEVRAGLLGPAKHKKPLRDIKFDVTGNWQDKNPAPSRNTENRPGTIPDLQLGQNGLGGIAAPIPQVNGFSAEGPDISIDPRLLTIRPEDQSAPNPDNFVLGEEIAPDWFEHIERDFAWETELKESNENICDGENDAPVTTISGRAAYTRDDIDWLLWPKQPAG